MTQVLSEKVTNRIDELLKKYPEDRRQSALLGALHAVQDYGKGYLTVEEMDAVAEYLRIDRTAVYEAASFYSMFHTEEVGRHKISICNNICCMLMGANEIEAYVEEKLGIKVGETTEDGRITLVKEEECLAACVGGPMMVVDGHYHEKLTPAIIDDILAGLE